MRREGGEMRTGRLENGRITKRVLPTMAGKKWIGLLAMLCLITVQLPTGITQDWPISTSAQAAVNNFSLDMYRTLVNVPGVTNLVFSPLSVSAALSAMSFGADGETKIQILNALRFEDDDGPTELTSKIADLQAVDPKDSRINERHNWLNLVTKLFLADYISANPDFTDAVGAVQSVKFQNPSSAAEQINSYISEQTNGKITGVLGAKAIDKLTALVLVNAIYFKGEWRTRFQDTEMAAFNGMKGPQEVEFMSVTGPFKWAQRNDLGATVVELPYKDSEFSMFVFLPLKDDDFTEMEEGIVSLGNDITNGDFIEEDMVISIPKFGFEAEFDLTDILPELGIVDLFDAEKSDLSKISDSGDLHVSRAFHRVLIQVDEAGTEAAAATTMTALSLSAPKMVFANRPFTFVIRDNSQGMVLFLGRVMSI